MDQSGKVANPARGQLRIWSRETGSAVPSRASQLILHTQAESSAYSRDSSRFPISAAASVHYEGSELLIYDGKKKEYAKKEHTKNRPPSPTAAVQLLANHILEDYCTHIPSNLFWRQRTFRRAIASSV